MKKKQLLSSVFIGLLASLTLSFLGASFISPKRVQAGAPLTIGEIAAVAPQAALPLSANSTTDEILATMVQSHQNWDTLQATYIARFYDQQNPGIYQEYQHAFWLDSAGNARVEIGNPDTTFGLLWVKNSRGIWAEDQAKGVYFRSDIPSAYATVENFGPRSGNPNNETTVVPHPVGLLMPSWLNEYVYPTSLAQSMAVAKMGDAEQIVEIVGTDNIAGRDTVIIQRKISSVNTLYKLHRYWVDAETGVLLKVEIYVPMTGELGLEVEVISVTFNDDIPADKFLLIPQPGSKQVDSVDYHGQQ